MHPTMQLTMTPTTTEATIAALPLTLMTPDAQQRCADTLRVNGVWPATLVGHHADIASDTVLLTITMTVHPPFHRLPANATGLDYAEAGIANAAVLFAALDTVCGAGMGSAVLTLHSVGMNTANVAMPLPVPVPPDAMHGLQAFEVEVEREVTVRRVVDEEATATQRRTLLIMAPDEATAAAMATRHGRGALTTNEEEWLDDINGDDLDWNVIGARGDAIELYDLKQAVFVSPPEQMPVVDPLDADTMLAVQEFVRCAHRDDALLVHQRDTTNGMLDEDDMSTFVAELCGALDAQYNVAAK